MHVDLEILINDAEQKNLGIQQLLGRPIGSTFQIRGRNKASAHERQVPAVIKGRSKALEIFRQLGAGSREADDDSTAWGSRPNSGFTERFGRRQAIVAIVYYGCAPNR
jgi:hypothetical protein